MEIFTRYSYLYITFVRIKRLDIVLVNIQCIGFYYVWTRELGRGNGPSYRSPRGALYNFMSNQYGCAGAHEQITAPQKKLIFPNVSI